MTDVPPTIDYRPSPAGQGASPRRGVGIGVVAGSGVHLSEETRSLLRIRLRAVALTMSFAFGAFFLRDLFLAGLFRDPLIRAFHITVVVAFAASFALLSSRRPLSLGQLRALELALFGMVVAFFITLHDRLVHLRAAENDRAMLMATVKNYILFLFAMIVLYGMFIPNTYRRAAAVVGLMFAAAVLAPLALPLVDPSAARALAPLLTFEVVTENLLMLAIGAGVTIYGAFIIHTLRVESFEARRLNQYRLGPRLGSGGMGVVHLAEHQMLKRPCAIKLITPARADDPDALARFEREVRTTARLSHPNTIEIYDYGQTSDGHFYYVMELLDGLNLADLVALHGPLPPARAIHLLRQACGALAEAHAAGLVHRDLKPANIFAARRGLLHDFVKILDFGLVLPPVDAEPFDDAAIVGSPLYMAPEQASGQSRPDARTDLYALGAVAYYLVTARPPFDAPTPAAVLASLSRDPLTPPSRHRPDLPPDLESLILRCLSRHPSDRYPDALSLDRALASCRDADQWTPALATAWWRLNTPTPP